jgi:hypothetical protein
MTLIDEEKPKVIITMVLETLATAIASSHLAPLVTKKNSGRSAKTKSTPKLTECG